VGLKYKGADKRRIKTMDCMYIYRYVFFAIGLLFHLGLIGFTWVALWKIHNTPVR
jgi:hypothetical protein